MKSGLISIMKKELTRFFTDPRMVLTVVLMPGLLFYLLYSLMGNAMMENTAVDSGYQPKVYAVNLPDSLSNSFSAAGLEFEEIAPTETETIKEQVAAKQTDLLIVFPKDFDTEVAAALNSEGTVTETELFYNSTRIESSTAYGAAQSVLASYKESLLPLFTINGSEDTYDLASREDATGSIFASLLPMLLLLFLYSGCIAVAPESIAGEKERGTIATLLVTPLKRWELALGKVLSLCFIALLFGASSFIGVMLSLPSMLQQGGDVGGEGIFASASLYGMQDYLMLLAVILSTIVLFVGLISIVSAFARSIKEASTLSVPIMAIVLVVGFSAMFQTSSTTEMLLYLIPVYNSVQSMIAIFSFTAEALPIALTIVVNFIATGLCIIVLTRMFNSERIVFSK